VLVCRVKPLLGVDAVIYLDKIDKHGMHLCFDDSGADLLMEAVTRALNGQEYEIRLEREAKIRRKSERFLSLHSSCGEDEFLEKDGKLTIRMEPDVLEYWLEHIGKGKREGYLFPAELGDFPYKNQTISLYGIMVTAASGETSGGKAGSHQGRFNT
jgi:hypothetical protein